MSAPNYSDSFRNVTRYLGQNYAFVPVYYRNRDPVDGTSLTVTGDIRPKEQQGKYPIGSVWNNTSSHKLWMLAGIISNQARWILIASSTTTGPLLTLSDNAGTVVTPTASSATPPGNIQLVAGGGISIVGTPASNIITIATVGGGNPIEQITTNLGGPVVPSLGNINANASVTTFTDGNTANTLKTEVQATNHSLIIGSGTNTAARSLGVATNGQIPIGSTGADPVLATLTAGAGIAIANNAGSITISVNDAGFAWNDVTGTSATMVKENGYVSDNVGLVTLTMPTIVSSTFGDSIAVCGFGAGGWKIQCVATQTIQFGNKATTAGGSISSTNQFDTIEIVCSPTTSTWLVRNAVGNLTLA